MRTKTNDSGLELGQVLPLVALMMVAIVGMIALIIDGGSLMSNRRSAQAAADAAALAGAKSLCLDDETGAIAIAHDYAINKNKATTSVETIVSSVLLNGHEVKGINVQTTVSNPSFFAGIFGESALLAKASATAGCYHPSITSHLMPIAFYYEQPPVKADDAECTDITDPCNLVEWDYLTLLNTLQTTPSVDMPFDFVYVIMNEIKICQKDVSGEIVCNNMVGNPEGGNRSWIDLTDLSAGKNLKQIIDEGISSPLILPSWLNGQPGVSADVFNESIYTDLPPIEGFETLTAKMILVPVFDNFCDTGDPEYDCPDEWNSGDRTEYIVNTNQPSFRLIGLSPFVITCVTKNTTCVYGSCIPKHTGVNTTNKARCPGYIAADPTMTLNNAIEGYFVMNSPLDQFTTGTEGVSAGLDIISLTE